jgi:hypothetical protein
VGLVFAMWAPVLPRWIGRVPEIDLRFEPGASAPYAVVWGGVEEAVEVRSRSQRDGSQRFRLALADGSQIEVAGRPGRWRREAERID